MDIDELCALGREIKLIVCDLDGTLLNSDKQISRANLQVIDRAREKGIFTTICSGRAHQMLQAYSNDLNISGPLIAANGAVVFDTRTGTILSQKPIDSAVALPLLRFCQHNGMDYAALAAQNSFFSSNSVRIRRFEQYNSIAHLKGLPPVLLRRFDVGHNDALSDTIYKILIFELIDGQQKIAEEYLRKIPELAYTSSEKGLLDVSATGVSKGGGVHALARLMKIDERQICVFGDYYNDIPMMEVAGLPIAMGNAPEEVKAAALAVTGHNDEDGVAFGIERYILQTEGNRTKNENP